MTKLTDNLYGQIRELLISARTHVRCTIDTVMEQAYFEIGRLIVENE